MADHSNEKCGHPSCTCRARKDSKYCSEYCADARDTTEISCGCGHRGCAVGESTMTGSPA